MSLLKRGGCELHPLASNSQGGTEYILSLLKDGIEIPSDVHIHFSRILDGHKPKDFPEKKHIYYCHDLAGDPYSIQAIDENREHIWRYVFVSEFQMKAYIAWHQLDASRCMVIPNASHINLGNTRTMTGAPTFIYHTTPHRGLNLLYYAFKGQILEAFPNAKLEVYSSFEVYGWGDRDRQFKDLFSLIDTHPQMRWHGYKPRNEVHEALKEADVFMYPSTWPETSCIALIEAARSGLTCVVPDYAALKETGEGYENVHVVRHHTNPVSAIRQISSSTINALNNLGESKPVINEKHSVESLLTRWKELLSQGD